MATTIAEFSSETSNQHYITSMPMRKVFLRELTSEKLEVNLCLYFHQLDALVLSYRAGVISTNPTIEVITCLIEV